MFAPVIAGTLDPNDRLHRRHPRSTNHGGVPAADIIRQLHQVVDAAIETQPDRVAEESAPYDISRIDFERLRQEFARAPAKRTLTQNLRQAIEQRLQRLLLQNPLRTDFQRHYEEVYPQVYRAYPEIPSAFYAPGSVAS